MYPYGVLKSQHGDCVKLWNWAGFVIKKQLVSTTVMHNLIAFSFVCFSSDQMQFVIVLRNNRLHFISVTRSSSQNKKDSS